MRSVDLTRPVCHHATSDEDLSHPKLCDTRRASLPPLDYLPDASQLPRPGGLILVCSVSSSPPSF